MFGIFGAIYGSSSYQKCSAEAGNESSTDYQGQEKDLPRTFVRLFNHGQIVFRCAEQSIAENNAVVSAVATVVIAVFTTILGLFTMSLAGSTRIAADAAKESADALKATERGILIEKISSVDFKRAYSVAESYPNSPTMWPINAELSTTITFKNYGKTPITIQEICGDIVIADAAPRVKDGVFAIEHKMTEYVISPQTESDVITFKRSKEISWDKNNKITRETMHIWLIGSVTFVDVFDVTCHREFVWKYSRRSNALKPYHSYEERNHQRAGLSEPP